MSKIHLLNVKNGDCTIIEHDSGRLTMIDICAGNIETETEPQKSELEYLLSANPKGNYGMCNKPTNPIEYLKKIDKTRLFRFILTHPDMDHLDGFNNLANNISICNFWDTGAKKEKPDFSNGPYKEEDWDRYIKFKEGHYNARSISQLAGAKFAYANEDENGNEGGDGLYILAPDKELVSAANESKNFNDGSYVILYRSKGGNIIIPGDAHDKTWNFILENFKNDIKNCKFLLAPHHGRDSQGDHSFLDIMKPDLTLFGCASSDDLAYSAWSSRDLKYVTQNQCGNMILETVGGKLDVYIENEKFARKYNNGTSINEESGYYYIDTL